MEIEFEIPSPLWEQLLILAAKTELSVEEILITAIQNSVERGGNDAD